MPGNPSSPNAVSLEQDGAEPSTNSVAASNLLRLSSLLAKEAYAQRAAMCFSGAAERLQRYPFVLSKMVVALMASQSSPPQIVVVGRGSDQEVLAMLQAVQGKYLAEKTLVFVDRDRQGASALVLTIIGGVV